MICNPHHFLLVIFGISENSLFKSVLQNYSRLGKFSHKVTIGILCRLRSYELINVGKERNRNMVCEVPEVICKLLLPKTWNSN